MHLIRLIWRWEVANHCRFFGFILQDTSQRFHWYNQEFIIKESKASFIMISWYNYQVTLHPIVTYYLDLREIHHVNYVVISDCLHHDTAAVHLFQRSFITFLKKLPPARLHFKKITYVSDDAASQYKTGRIYWIRVTTKMILELQLNDIFQPLYMEREHKIVWLEQSSN